MVLPEGVKGVWNLSTADREATPTRERVSLKGLWQWQPAGDAMDSVPADGWGYVQVPGAWPRGPRRDGSAAFYPHPSWQDRPLGDVTAAWYQIEIGVPAEWVGRRIGLSAEFLNSFASVYVDGRKAGEMRFPAGEMDLTSLCQPGRKHVLSMLVLAMPLKAVMLSFSDSDAARQVRGQVERRGLCGDVYLMGTPQAARIRAVRVETSVRKWQITFDTALDGVDPQATYALRAEVKDGERTVKEFTSKPFRGTELSDGRMAVTEEWHPDKLWDIHTPGNQYDVSLSLLDASGRLLDTALPERFGFREFWIDGRDFYLNGARIFLSFTRSQPGWSYEEARQALGRTKGIGINFVAAGGFGCEPGAHLSLKEVLRATDDAGALVALTQPHMGQYDWDAPDADKTNGYAEHAEFYTRVAGNHPSVVFYATSHNACGYAEDMNPDLIDGLVDRAAQTRGRNVECALRAEAIVRRLDDSRILYHHASGNLSSMHTSNFYANFAPIQEMSDWFEHWATVGVKPLHLNEYGVPYPWDWSMYRGWYKGKREFGSAVVPWEFCLAEWNAQFYGPEAYRIGEPEKANLRWEAQKFRDGALWHRWDLPYNLNYAFPEREGVYSMYVTDNWRAFRTWGLSVNDPSDYANYAPEALIRNNMPLLAYIGGKPEAFTSKDHNFLPGETVRKQLIVINNCRETVTADCQWSFALPRVVTGSKTITLPTGQQERIPLAFELPAGLAPGQYTLTAAVRFSNDETQQDSFAIDVLPAPTAVEAKAKIALYDPKGDTGKLLTAMGVASQPVEAGADLSTYDTLIVGKGALTLDGPAPDISRVRQGLKVVVFEQTAEVLEKRFGFRIAEYGLRWVFRRVPDHPLLAGIADEHLRNWRGEATILPPRGTYEMTYHSPMSKWCDITVTQRWRCGNRGNVASVLIEKPACGDFLSVLDGGYSLQYTSLMEYREGKGVVLFCQTDVSGRTESDPAAEALARSIIRYVSGWQPAARRGVVYAGDPAGRDYLRSAGVAVASYEAGNLSPDQVLVVGPGGGQQLAAGAEAVARFLGAGGRVLAIGLSEEEANAFLPVKVKMKVAEHIAAYFGPQGAGSALAGVSPAEVHNRDPRQVPLVAEGAEAVGDGVLATAEDGRVVFWQLAPWQFDYSGEKMNIKRTFRRLSCCTTRLLGNLGAGGETPLLGRFSSPVAEGEQRWLKGLYLDVPEEWDYPYRFFRW
jgi:beta-galactosidase